MKGINITSTDRKEIFTLAWAMFRQNRFLGFGYCLKTAWAVVRLRKMLHTGTVRFTYQKTDGEVREATGTLCPELFEYARKTDGTKVESVTLVKYFDMDKNAFRSFRAERLLGIAA